MATSVSSNAPVRMFGRYQLLRLLGKSERSMAWAAAVPRTEQELMLVLPRVQPAGSAGLERWTQAVQRGARLEHPNLAPALEVGVQDGWPFAAYELNLRATWAERQPSKGWPAAELVPLALQALQALAFAHEGNVVHHDLQPFHLLVSENGQVRLTGLEVAASEDSDAADRQARRAAAERDVLAMGLVLHQALAGAPALDEPDTGRVIARLPPLGRDIVRLPWSLAQPAPEVLRAIVNRATERQERQRYRSARTLHRALEGFQKAESGGAAGPLALLGDKLRAAGALPSLPGAAQQAARLALMERERTGELAEIVLKDLALAFELLRTVNTAQVRGLSGSGPVLTVRRAIAMVGLDGVRRAALALRPWPGPLDAGGAAELERAIVRAKRAGRLAQAIRPAGYDAEVVYLIALLQNVGRLVVQYHFADEAAQIRRLMQPGDEGEPGMSEEAAAFAVLGAGVEAIGTAVARHWGLDDSVLLMLRRLPLEAPVHGGDTDEDLLRVAASCANETIDALALPAERVPTAMQRVVQRYGRVLGLSLKDLQEALKPPAADGAAPAAEGRAPVLSPAPADAAAPALDTAAEPAPAAGGPGGLRAAMAARAAARSAR